jgi:hypothetical protein
LITAKHGERSAMLRGAPWRTVAHRRVDLTKQSHAFLQIAPLASAYAFSGKKQVGETFVAAM